MFRKGFFLFVVLAGPCRANAPTLENNETNSAAKVRVVPLIAEGKVTGDRARMGDLASPLASQQCRDNIAVHGADPTGIVDATSIIQTSAATGKTVYIPPGVFTISNMISISNGQCIIGEDRTMSILHVNSAFNPTAPAVVQLGTSEPGGCMHNVGIVFDQPLDQSSRENFKTLAAGCTSFSGGTGCRYPPAITTAARSILDSVRISGAWDGVIDTGNTGGIYYNNLEIGALNVGLSEDGGLDFCHLSGLHFWPFGMSSDKLYADVYDDGSTIAANLGRCDDWEIRGLSTFNGAVNILADSTQVAIENLILDGDHANLSIAGGVNALSNVYSTKGNTATDLAMTVTAGATTISNLLISGSSPAPLITQTGGILHINGGRILHNSLAYPAVAHSGGFLYIDNLEMYPAAGTHTAPFITSTGPIFQARNNIWHQMPRGSSGIALKLGLDGSAHFVAGNDFGGWSFSPYGGGTTGTYGPNRTSTFSFIPTLRPIIPGTWAPIYTAQNGRYWYTGQGIEFEISITFTTNAYSDASGGIVVTGLPFPNLTSAPAGISADTVQITGLSNVTFTAGYSAATASLGNTATSVVLGQMGSGVPAAVMSSANFPPSTADIAISAHGFIHTN